MTNTNIQLSELLDGIVTVSPAIDCVVESIALDTRKIRAGDVFLAVGGASFSAKALVSKAIAAGAKLVLLDDAQKAHGCIERIEDVPVLSVHRLKQNLGRIFEHFYHDRIEGVSLVGVTGTNGKTSVTYFVAQLREFLQQGKQGVIGTVGFGAINELQDSTHTTPDIASVYSVLAQLNEDGFKGVAMEVSSHALDQNRVGLLKFDVCVFTNLTRDHLDYHGSMAAYAEAKSRLFSLNPQAHAVVNLDDEYGKTLIQQLSGEFGREVISYGIDSPSATLQATELQYVAGGAIGNLLYKDQKVPFETGLVGAFNIQNLLAAVGVCLLLGEKLTDIASNLKKVSPVPGRMQKVVCSTYKKAVQSSGEHDAKPLALIDYAHTPDALANALVAIRQHTNARLWCVFGCGGDRDRGKRAQMGAVVEAQADQVVITSDNPRSEDPYRIIEDILAGIKDKTRVHVELDRSKAIHWAVGQADREDVLLIAGKGHETYQEIAGKRLPFNDATVVSEALCLKVAS